MAATGNLGVLRMADQRRDIGYLGALIALLFSLIIAVLVFRFAFGVELPNPIHWLWH